MTPRVCDTLELDDEAFEIIRVVHGGASRSPTASDRKGVPAALVCTSCGCRSFGCTFKLIDSRLCLVALFSRGAPLDEVRHAEWLLPPHPGSTSDNLQRHSLPAFSGRLVVARGRSTLNDDHDQAVWGYTNLEPWAEFDDVQELDFENGVLQSRIDASMDAVRARERGRDGEAPVDR